MRRSVLGRGDWPQALVEGHPKRASTVTQARLAGEHPLLEGLGTTFVEVHMQVAPHGGVVYFFNMYRLASQPPTPTAIRPTANSAPPPSFFSQGD